MTDKPDKNAKPDGDVGGYILKTLQSQKKSVIAGLIVRIVLLALVLIYMSWLYGKLSQVDADTVVSAARHKLSQEMPDLTKELSEKLKETAPDVMKKLEERSLEAIPELGAMAEERIVARIHEVGDEIEKTLEEEIKKQVNKELARIEKESPGLPEEEKLSALMEALRVRFKSNATNATEIALKKIDYWGQMKEINDWLIHLQRGEGLTEKEEYQKELIAATLKMIELKTGDGLVRKKQ